MGGGLWWWRAATGSELERAAALAPADAERLSWTDWSGVRRELDADLSDSSSAAELAGFLDRGFDADLTSTSALLASAPVLQSRFGFSPATVEWELFSQSSEGAVVILRLPDSTEEVSAILLRARALASASRRRCFYWIARERAPRPAVERLAIPRCPC